VSLQLANFKSDVYAAVRDTLRSTDDERAVTIAQVNNAIQSAESAPVLSCNVDLSLPEMEKTNKIAATIFKGAVTLAMIPATGGAEIALGGASLGGNLIEGLIGKITEQTLVKPQRQRIINDWIMFTLQPEFKQNLERISREITGNMETLLIESSQGAADELRNNLQTLKAKKDETASAHQERIVQLRAYKTALITDGGTQS
jgi:hypothetical protein